MSELVLKYWRAVYEHFVPFLSENVSYSLKPRVVVTPAANNCMDLYLNIQKDTMSDINRTLNTSSGAVIVKFAILWTVALFCKKCSCSVACLLNFFETA
jgi:hypothetical protein